MPHEDDLQKLGRNVRTARKRAGLTQEGLAERSELHPTYIGGIERGERNIGVLNLIGLARALNVDPDEFFVGIRTRTAIRQGR